MSLTGRPLVIALVVAAAVGVAAGSFASGWSKARGLPGPECVADAGVVERVETVTILVPDIHLASQQAAWGAAQASTEAEATSTAKAAPAAKVPIWEAGPAALVNTRTGELLFGGATGVNLGPFGARVTLVGNAGGLYAGGALVWRF